MKGADAEAGRDWLTLAGGLSAAAALLHVGCIVGGASWYRFFGAGEGFAVAAEQGAVWPALVTLAIAAILAIWAAYAFSGAGRIRRLPLLSVGLVTITLIYLVRGALILPILLQPLARTPFNVWSSLIVLGYGIVHAVGLRRAWPYLSKGTPS